MSKVIDRLREEWEEHKGEFVLTQSHRLERFIAIGDDGDDFYYITYNGREITWNSAVGKLIYLKGKIDDYDYDNFIRLAKLNHWDQSEHYRTVYDNWDNSDTHKRECEELNSEIDKFITDVCWDLN